MLLSFFLIIGLDFVLSTMRIASSKISFRPYWVRALHSIYLHWNSSSMILRAVSLLIGASFGSFFFAANSSRKSILFPIKILGTLVTLSWSYGYH